MQRRDAVKGSTDDFTMKVFVRTKRVFARLSRISELNVTPMKTFRVYRTVLEYEDILDNDQKAYLGNAREFADQVGLSMQVVDLAKQNLFSRLGHLIRGSRSVPSAMLPKSVFLSRRIVESKIEFQDGSPRDESYPLTSDEKVKDGYCVVNP
jgi:hypothetical protein